MVCVCVWGKGNKDEKTTYPLARAYYTAIRAISSPTSTVSGISLFIFLARIISLMYAKQRTGFGEEGGERRISFEKPTCASIGVESARTGTRGLQLLRPFFNGKVVLMNKSLFPYIYI